MRQDDAHLLDMLVAPHKASMSVDGPTYEQFVETDLHRYAIFEALAVVGEAVWQANRRRGDLRYGRTVPLKTFRRCQLRKTWPGLDFGFRAPGSGCPANLHSHSLEPVPCADSATTTVRLSENVNAPESNHLW